MQLIRNMNNKFAICIPTYNRCSKLKECLDSFIDDAVKYNINIYISNNASTDNTQNFLKEYSSKYPNIYYANQSLELHLDLNMLNVLEMAQSEYALWLGDDDKLNKNALELILKNIELTPDLIILKSMTNIFDNHLKLLYTNPFDFFCDYGMIGLKNSMHFSTMVVKNSEIKKLGNKERYKGTYHLYAGVILDYLMDIYEKKLKNNILYINVPLVIIDTKNKSWQNILLKIYFKCIPDWIDLLNCKYTMNDKVKNKIKEFQKLLNDINDYSFICVSKKEKKILFLVHKIFFFIYKLKNIKWKLK